ncbi:ATP synthase F1 subunit delta [Mucilaginibacter auburnensis]|uniref:ATP synthase subunit delta n=1 Tax=Mucilaginibacter auburnensis TaxID=1457233 RepID=A0A2H9VND3_9SPHI|nr:ATP synthase F1 subunit delta [Mucilaginibacter auburnensis]PJJ79823.1 F-type H+-transporting ATPase subunit delta [Mucilaginibacter auburnensis]
MSELTVASRYAKSLIDLSEEQNLLEVVNGDMGFFVKTLKENAQLKAVLSNPIISHSKKLNILTDVFGSKVNALSIGFFKLMVSKGRGQVIYATAKQFIELYNVKKHITKATVVSATPLSDANKQQLLAEVKAAVGGEITLVAKVDPSLIGGFVLTIGDKQLDTSVQGSLNKLKKNFATAAV